MTRDERAAAYLATIREAMRIIQERAEQDARLASCEELYDLCDALAEIAEIDMPAVS